MDPEVETASRAPKLWRGQTLRDRSHDRYEQLRDVGFELLGTGGSAAVTMRAVTRAANLSPRYFYESFDSREALVTAVYDHVEARLLERLLAVDHDADLRATVRAALEVTATYFEEDSRRARVLLREPLIDDTLRDHRADRLPAFVLALAFGLGAESPPPDDPATLAVVASAMSGALVSLYLDWVEGRLALDRGQVVEATVDIVLRLAEIRVESSSATDGEVR